jgi:hypothetical protein
LFLRVKFMAGGLNTKLLWTIYDVLGLRSLFGGENPSSGEKLRGYFIIPTVLPVPCRLGDSAAEGRKLFSQGFSKGDPSNAGVQK